MRRDVVILGAGVTGLAAARVTGGVVYEAEENAGGLIATYGRRADGTRVAGDDPTGYRFEVGGGHWIFDRSPAFDAVLERYGRRHTYTRRAAVWLRAHELSVPYPLQDHVDQLPLDLRKRIAAEVRAPREVRSMRDWLEAQFGATLCETFFHPFHEAYTAGLAGRVAPQDAQKSPAAEGRDAEVRAGAGGAGYNVQFTYPEDGLGRIIDGLVAESEIRFGHRAVAIDVRERVVRFDNGVAIPYATLISTLPLNHLLLLAGIDLGIAPDPYTSVLVINVGATRGKKCPTEHWVYVDASASGFHRIGFYSNVDERFLPGHRRGRGTHVSAYVERAFAPGERCDGEERRRYVAAVIAELRDWEVIDEVEVVDASWVETAYTWSWIGSPWRERALAAVEAHGIRPLGRYARWTFQGIGASFEQGLTATPQTPRVPAAT